MGRPYLAASTAVLLVFVVASCGGETPVDPPDPPGSLCAAKHRPPWTRAHRGVGGAVTVNEIMYQPAGGGPEWLELYNPLAFDLDVSDFRLAGDVQLTFPAGTLVPARGYLVVASRPMAGAAAVFTGALPDGSGVIELWNNAGRLMDVVAYRDDEPWPVAADGSGASLAKRDPDTASELAEVWTASARVGGTPGEANLPVEGPPPSRIATALVTADNHVAVYLGKADGSGLRLIGRDTAGDWSSPETFSFEAAPDEHLYLAAWEAPGGNGGPQMLIGQVAVPGAGLVSTGATTFEWALGPPNASPGGAVTDPAPPLVQVQAVIAGASWAAPAVTAEPTAAPWGGALGAQFAPATRYLWADTFADDSITNQQTTYVLFRSTAPLPAPADRPAGGDAPAPPALALSEVGGGNDPLWVELVNRGDAPVDVGGAVLRAGGGEHVLAARSLAPGELLLLDAGTLGLTAGPGDALFLLAADREAVLDAVRVAEVARARVLPALDWRWPDAASPGEPNVVAVRHDVVINEIMYSAPPVAAADGTIGESKLEWIELFHRGSEPLDVGGYQLVDGVAFEIPAGTTMAPGSYLVIAGDLADFTAAYPDVAGTGTNVLGNLAGGLSNSGDRVVLRDACANPVDEVRYVDGGRWPALADGGGSSLERRHPDADGRAPEAWAASDEAARAAWQTISYEAVAAPSAVGPDGVWQELVLGLLDAGEVLLDDVSVVVDPATAPVELIAGGDFEAGAGAFRARGNHRHAEVIDDPTSPGNRVLRVRSTGQSEHMHNLVETTLTGGHRITNGRTYRVSLRARWQGGNHLLNTRLYFDRLARTTALAIPTQPGTPGARNSRAVDNLGPTYDDLRHWPPVPAPGQPVEVSVRAGDPDGVASLTLRTSVDGGPPQSTPMTAGADGRAIATVTAGPAGSQVQFWIEATDGRGAVSTFPAAGPASRALWRVEDGRAAGNGLHDLRILMTAADAAWLFDARNLMSNDPVPATIISDERVVTYDAGVRLKGSQRGRPTTQRIGFGLRFPADQPFRGILRTVLVDRSQGVGYGQREVFFFQAMNRAGAVPSQYDDLIKILSPRTDLDGPAHLQLARFGDTMLDAQFDGGGDGELFEYELVYFPTTTTDGTPTGAKLPQPDQVVGTAIRDLGDDEEAYRYTFIIKGNRWRDDYRGLIRFARAFGQTGAAFDAGVGDVIDVDQWLRAFAFSTLSGAVDNYASGAAHNAEFYLRPDDGRALYFPHDLDFLGGPQGPVVGSGDLARLMAVPARARAYYGHLHDIITTSFNGTYLRHWAEQLGALLPGQNFAGHLQYVVDRAAWVMDGAPNAITRSIPRIAFAVTTSGGGPLTVMAATVELEGQGWVDVDRIVREGTAAPLAVSWPAAATWRATVALACGANDVRLEARDRRGALVGADAIAVTRTGPGC